MTHRFALTVLVFLLGTLHLEAQELTVQRSWKLLAVGLDAPADLRVEPLLLACEDALERELPGLEVRFARGAYRNHQLEKAQTQGLNNQALAALALRLAEASGQAIASFDVVFVFTPHLRKSYLGLSHLEGRDRRGRSARAALIQTRPFPALARGLRASLEGQPLKGFAAEERPLDPRLRQALLRLLQRGERPLRRLCELPGIREALLAPTLAHEFGHFLAPGDLDVRDGYQEGWLRHATGPRDNPEAHQVSCCMYKGRGLRFYLDKLLAIRGRLVRFCDPCRKQLGCAQRP